MRHQMTLREKHLLICPTRLASRTASAASTTPDNGLDEDNKDNDNDEDNDNDDNDGLLIVPDVDDIDDGVDELDALDVDEQEEIIADTAAVHEMVSKVCNAFH